MGTVVNIDGTLFPPDEAKVSVFDRGFLYGDSIYEVVRTYGGKPFELDAHLERLARSGERIALSLPWDRARLSREVTRTLDAANNLEEGRESYIRVVVTRGSGEIGLDPALAVDPRTVIVVRPLVMPPREAYTAGIEVAVVGVERTAPTAIDPSAKTGNYLNNLLALKEARDRGAYEAVMLDAKGRITEGSTSNVFVVKDGRLKTPPKEVGLLEGVTRRTVLSVARDLGLPTDEVHLGPEDLRGADEAFITSTIREIVPVTRCDGQAIGAGRVGPLTTRVQAGFRARTGEPVDRASF
jgi:branched-chain amino acid aminotransferase